MEQDRASTVLDISSDAHKRTQTHHSTTSPGSHTRRHCQALVCGAGLLGIWAVSALSEAGGLTVLGGMHEARAATAVTYAATAAAEGSMIQRKCARALERKYWDVTCPVWNNQLDDEADRSVAPEALQDADWKVRHIWHRLNPASCEDARFTVTEHGEGVGFGAMMLGHLMGTFGSAYKAGTVLVHRPTKKFVYGGCNSTSYTCYFEPISNCTYDTHVAPLVERYGMHGWDNSSAKVGWLTGWRTFNWIKLPKVSDFFHIGADNGEQELMTGLLLYLLRLNKVTRERIETVLREALPCDLDPSRTISLPIRASDKCIEEFHLDTGMTGESDCLSFDMYMEIAQEIRRLDPRVDTIILTSEDRRFVDARVNYTGSSWRFIVNPVDIMQASGTAAYITAHHDVDKVFLSFYSSLQLQMRGKYFVLNCVSHFHGILRLLVEYGGCSFVPRPEIICLNLQAHAP